MSLSPEDRAQQAIAHDNLRLEAFSGTPEFSRLTQRFATEYNVQAAFDTLLVASDALPPDLAEVFLFPAPFQISNFMAQVNFLPQEDKTEQEEPWSLTMSFDINGVPAEFNANPVDGSLFSLHPADSKPLVDELPVDSANKFLTVLAQQILLLGYQEDGPAPIAPVDYIEPAHMLSSITNKLGIIGSNYGECSLNSVSFFHDIEHDRALRIDHFDRRMLHTFGSTIVYWAIFTNEEDNTYTEYVSKQQTIEQKNLSVVYLSAEEHATAVSPQLLGKTTATQQQALGPQVLAHSGAKLEKSKTEGDGYRPSLEEIADRQEYMRVNARIMRFIEGVAVRYARVPTAVALEELMHSGFEPISELDMSSEAPRQSYEGMWLAPPVEDPNA